MCVSVMHYRLEAQYMAALELIDRETVEELMTVAQAVDGDKAVESLRVSTTGPMVGPSLEDRLSQSGVVWRNNCLEVPSPPTTVAAGRSSPSRSNSSQAGSMVSTGRFPPAVLGVLMASSRRRSAALSRQSSANRHSTMSQSSAGSVPEKRTLRKTSSLDQPNQPTGQASPRSLKETEDATAPNRQSLLEAIVEQDPDSNISKDPSSIEQ